MYLTLEHLILSARHIGRFLYSGLDTKVTKQVIKGSKISHVAGRRGTEGCEFDAPTFLGYWLTGKVVSLTRRPLFNLKDNTLY
jgi:hypothetical protein